MFYFLNIIKRKKKRWTRFELDIILERNEENRFIPIKLDDSKILGLPSSIIYLPFKNNYEEIVEICIKKLLLYEKDKDIKRESEFSKILKSLRDSKGEVDKAYQLVVDKKERTPLADIIVPICKNKVYKIIEVNPLHFSVLKRYEIRIELPADLTKDTIRQNIFHCMAIHFNKLKPDALCLFAYCKNDSFYGFINRFNVAKADFAPYGKWEKAEDGYAYNLPVSKFEYKIDFVESYFNYT